MAKAKEPKPHPPGWQEQGQVREPCKACGHGKGLHEDHGKEHGECSVYFCGCGRYRPK
jgi:hypothetical protein